MPASTAIASQESSYAQILRSSALIGGASVLTIVVGMVRTKAMALMLGPAGFGLFAIYTSLADLVRSFAEVGISSSGVRQIAEAAGSGQTDRIVRTAIALRRTTVILGVLGAILTLVLSAPLSTFSFESLEHQGAIALLSLAVMFKIMADGQGALIQGMRRITDLACMNVLGGVLGSLACVSLIYVYGAIAIPVAVVAIAAMSLVVSGWYSRRVRLPTQRVSNYMLREEVGGLLKMGTVFMLSSLLMMVAGYGVRIMMLRIEGLEAAGFYQAAWTLGGIYVGIILQAMGADFYPRLTAAAQDVDKVNRLVNEQAHVSLLLAGPGVIATITLAVLLMVLFYSPAFVAAGELLRWICLGMALRVVSWPLGYIVIARGERMAFFLTELAWTLVNLSLSFALISAIGLSGAGIAFCLSYVFHAVMLYFVVHRSTGFVWSQQVALTALFMLVLVACVFTASFYMPAPLLFATGSVLTLVSGVYALRRLVETLGMSAIPASLRKMLVLGRLVPADILIEGESV